MDEINDFLNIFLVIVGCKFRYFFDVVLLNLLIVIFVKYNVLDVLKRLIDCYILIFYLE